MGAFISSELNQQDDEVKNTYLSQTDANKDYVRRTPYDTDQQSLRSDMDKKIRDLRGQYTDGTLSDLQGDYNSKFTGLRGTYTDGTLGDLQGDYNSKFTGLRGGYDKNLSQLQGDLQADYNSQFTTLRGGYDKSLSQLQSELQAGYNSQFSTLRGDYKGSLTELQNEYKSDLSGVKNGIEGELDTRFSTLRGTYAGNLKELQDDIGNNISSLRGTYTVGTLGELKSGLEDGYNGKFDTLRGGYNKSLSELQTELNTNYATLDGAFKEFRDKSYAADKAFIVDRANSIEDLIKAEAGRLDKKFDEDLSAFKTDYNNKLNTYALKKTVEDLGKTVDAGLTPNELRAIKAILNSTNFTNTFNDLKARGLIVEPTPAQYLRHLRRKNYIVY